VGVIHGPDRRSRIATGEVKGGGAMENKTTFFLIDEQAIFRDCVRFMLEKEKNLVWVGEAGNGKEAVSKVKGCRPDVVLMELSLPKPNGSSVKEEIKSLSTLTKVIVLSSDDSHENVLAAFQGGASAYCLKNSSFSEVLQALSQVTAGRSYLSPEIAGKVLRGYLGSNNRLKSQP
jgi:DNA-binding NarL/FixJ family response regulator